MQKFKIQIYLTNVLGEFVGEQILAPKQNHYENVHLVGYCMGAHIAGFAGKYIKTKTINKSIPRITGLDPSGPLFHDPQLPKSEKLHSEDAHIVDVTHTDSGFFGYIGQLGTIDFYPNGGIRKQPGCELSKSTKELTST